MTYLLFYVHLLGARSLLVCELGQHKRELGLTIGVNHDSPPLRRKTLLTSFA